MANNKTLFYTVNATNIAGFKNKQKDGTIDGIGFVDPVADGEYGYIVANGQQYGASTSDVNTAIVAITGNAVTYTADEAEEHNSGLPGSVVAGDSKSEGSDEKYTADEAKEHNAELPGAVKAGDIITINEQINSLSEQITNSSISVDEENNKFTDNTGSEITVQIVDGKITLSKYTAAVWQTLAWQTTTIVSKESNPIEYGTAYSVSISVTPSNKISYTINPGTETISNRKITIGTTEYALESNSGTLTITEGDGYKTAAAETYTGTCTGNVSWQISVASSTGLGVATASTKGEMTQTLNAGNGGTAKAKIQTAYCWIYSDSPIVVTTPGTETTANGKTFLAETETSGTKTLTTTKATSFTIEEGKHGYIALKKSWGTPKFYDPKPSSNTAWQPIGTLSIYAENDYDVYCFFAADNVTPGTFNSGAKGTWTIQYE